MLLTSTLQHPLLKRDLTVALHIAGLEAGPPFITREHAQILLGEGVKYLRAPMDPAPLLPLDEPILILVEKIAL